MTIHETRQEGVILDVCWPLVYSDDQVGHRQARNAIEEMYPEREKAKAKER